TINRKVARTIAEGKAATVEVKPEDLDKYLGPERFEYGLAEKEDQVGAATGVSVSEHGGDVLTVEATIMDQGSKQEEFVLTGQIQKVMEESAIAALSYVRAHYAELRMPKKNKKDLVDVPQEVIDTVDIKLMETIDEVLKAALLPGPNVTPAQIEAARPSIAPSGAPAH